MDNIRILIDGIEKNVYGLFYIFESKYYFIYTEKEVDDNNYVVLYMTQIGKETINTETGPVDTGYMIGVEITDPAEQQKVQTSISYIVEDKKNNTVNPQIQYVPINMLSNLKIISKKRFRLLKSIVIDNFKLDIDSDLNNFNIVNMSQVQMPIAQPIPLGEIQPTAAQTIQLLETQIPGDQPIPLGAMQPQNFQLNGLTGTPVSSNVDNTENNSVIVDYRTKYFELDEKNKELENQILMLTEKLNEIKKVIE